MPISQVDVLGLNAWSVNVNSAEGRLDRAWASRRTTVVARGPHKLLGVLSSGTLIRHVYEIRVNGGAGSATAINCQSELPTSADMAELWYMALLLEA